MQVVEAAEFFFVVGEGVFVAFDAVVAASHGLAGVRSGGGRRHGDKEWETEDRGGSGNTVYVHHVETHSYST